LMRLAPVALADALRPLDAVRHAAQSARTTHGAPEAADAARYLAALLLGALRGDSAGALLGGPAYEPVPGLWEREPLHPKVAAVAAGSFREKAPPAIRGRGYVVDSLEAALWALHTSGTFEAGALAAVNLGEDADTTAAIFGQLAGALYGLGGIPARWRERIVRGDEIVALADGLLALARGRTA
jgi:ADP-ribosyl-[dinitrogen reductase] hydrolase